MRIAWNVLVAGCFFWPTLRRGVFNDAASCAVREIGASFARSDNRASNASRVSFLTEVFEVRASILFHPRSRAIRWPTTRVRVHSHVEWAIAHETEASIGFIQLWRGNAEVEKQSVDFFRRALFHQ